MEKGIKKMKRRKLHTRNQNFGKGKRELQTDVLRAKHSKKGMHSSGRQVYLSTV